MKNVKNVSSRMRRAALATAVLIGCYIGAAVGADKNPSDIYLSKEYWVQTVWTDAQSSALWQLAGWRPYTGKNDPAYYATFVNTGKFTMRD
jgi:hypothetical protein